MKSVSNAYKALQKAIAGNFTARKDAINDTKLNAYWREVAEAVEALGESIESDDAKPVKNTRHAKTEAADAPLAVETPDEVAD